MASTEVSLNGSISKGAKKAAIFVCETCQKQGLEAKYSRIEYLHRHERTHTESKPFACEYCSKRYARSDVLFRHRRKCSVAHQNGRSASNTDAAASLPAPSSRTKARQEARPYPSLDMDSSPAGLHKPDHVCPPIGPASFETSPPNDSTSGGSSPSPSSETSPSTLVDLLPSDLPLIPSCNADTMPTLLPNGLGANKMTFDENQLKQFMPSVAMPGPIAQAADDTQTSALLPWEIAAWQNELNINLIVPEQTLLSTEHEVFRERCGAQFMDKSNMFYFDPERLMYCYTIPQWNMPSASKMSALAYRTYNSVLEHLGVFHMPTFTLDTAHIWVTFAMCTTAPRRETDMRFTPITKIGETPEIQAALEELDQNPLWPTSQDIIRREKTELLVKSFYQTAKGRKLTAQEALPLIHALLLYNSTSFLSENQKDRLAGELYLATITSVARQSGLFHPGSDCTTPGYAPEEDRDQHWKKWITHESWRRTAWLVYTLDTLASLETNAIVHVPTRDIRHIPLPYGPKLWTARTTETWIKAMMNLGLAGLTLEDGMACLSDPYGTEVPLYRREIGPYARHVLILTVLRGITSYGKGEPKGGYITKRWVLGRSSNLIRPEGMHAFIIGSYIRILDNWRQGWDLDLSCHLNYRGVHFVNDALPPYWLCRALIDKLAPIPPAHVPSLALTADDGIDFDEDGPNRLADVNMKEMLSVARQFVTNGEGLGAPLQQQTGCTPPGENVPPPSIFSDLFTRGFRF